MFTSLVTKTHYFLYDIHLVLFHEDNGIYLLAIVSAHIMVQKDPGLESCLRTASSGFFETGEVMTGAQSLDVNTLKKLLATIDGDALNLPLTTDTIIVSGDGETVSQSSSSRNAILEFFDNFFTTTSPSEIWMNKSPCPQCMHSIMDNYKDETKVIINIADIDPRNLSDTVESFKCLAVMLRKNHTIRHWNWGVFSDSLNLKTNCEELVNSTTNSTRFEENRQELSSVLDHIQEIREIPESIITTWCPKPVTTAAGKKQMN